MDREAKASTDPEESGKNLLLGPRTSSGCVSIIAEIEGRTNLSLLGPLDRCQDLTEEPTLHQVNLHYRM